MKLGLGSGTTARRSSTSSATGQGGPRRSFASAPPRRRRSRRRALGIPLWTLDEIPELDLTVDGADEVDPQLRLIKGGGGALLREKIVAAASKRMAVIVDSSKLVRTLGAFPLPIEVVPFGLAATRRHIERAFAGLDLAGQIRLRGGSTPFVTDGGHYILDCSLGAIARARSGSARTLAIDSGRCRARAVHRPRARGHRRRRRGRSGSWRSGLKFEIAP